MQKMNAVLVVCFCDYFSILNVVKIYLAAYQVVSDVSVW